MFGQVSPLFGVQVVESIHATAEPTAQPITLDMREMVDRLRHFGQIKRRPAAFTIGDNKMVVHPVILRQMRDTLSRRMDQMAEAAFMGAVR